MSEPISLVPGTPIEWADLASAVLAELDLISGDPRNRVLVRSVAALVDERALGIEFTVRSVTQIHVETFHELETYAGVRGAITTADLAGWLYGELEESVLAVNDPPSDLQRS